MTTPRDAGANPNILTMISFEAKLPKEAMYCPSLACTVYDNIARGRIQPRIGTFVINIGEAIAAQKDERDEMLEKGKMLIQDIKQIESNTPDFDPKNCISEYDSKKMYIESIGFEFNP